MKRRLEDLYVRYGPMIYRRCLFMLKDEDAAYDALQEIFLKLMDSPATLLGMREPVPYLYRIATNHSLNAIKKNRRSAGSVALEELPDEREDGLAASMLLDALCSGFGGRTRAVVYYRFVDGMSLEEIADLVKISRSAVRKHLDKFKARARKDKERIV